MFPTRTLSLLLVSTSIAISARAQGPTGGIKVGANFSGLYSGEVSDENLRTGFNAGLFARSTAEDPLGLQVELLYTTKGNHTHYQGFFGLVDQDVDFNLNYIELPALFSLRFADGAFEVQAGGYLGYLVGAHVSSNGDLGNGSQDLDRDNFNALDGGLAGGVAFNAGALQLGVRYDLGLANIASSDAAKDLLGDARNTCLQVYIGFGLPR